MGKIRSTLDIVLEKTKNLNMDQDTKKGIRHRELADQARALVQRYMGSKATLNDVRAELDSSGAERPEFLELVTRDLLEHIQIDSDNRRVLDALEAFRGVKRDRAESSITAFRKRLDGEMIRQLAELRDGLEARGIRGSAVIPNITRSAAWQDTLKKAGQVLVDELVGLL
jgi:hypothetical protein